MPAAAGRTLGRSAAISVSGGRVVGGSGPGGSAIVGQRGGVAVGPFGGVAAGGTRFAAGHSTHYMSGAAIRTTAVGVRGGYHYGAFTTGWYGRYPGAWRAGAMGRPQLLDSARLDQPRRLLLLRRAAHHL